MPASLSTSLDDLDRPVITPPEGRKKVLLHSCCAPCSGEVMEAMQASGIEYSIYFYNPNIHPREEYELRKAENIRFAEKHNTSPSSGRGLRHGQLVRPCEGPGNGNPSAARAVPRCASGSPLRSHRASMRTEEWLPRNHELPGHFPLEKHGADQRLRRTRRRPSIRGSPIGPLTGAKRRGAQRMVEISKRERFYMQEYCGCIYSLRDTNKWRLASRTAQDPISA